MLMLTNPESPAIPTTGNLSLLCFRTIRVPGWSGIVGVFDDKRNFSAVGRVEGAFDHEGLKIQRMPTHAFHGRLIQEWSGG